MKIVPKALFKAGVSAPAVNLSVPRKTGAYRMTKVVAGMFLPELASEFRTLRARPHETHFTAENIPELGKLIETEASKGVADFRASGIAGHCPDRAKVPFGALMHGPELDDGEGPASEADTRLPVENPSTVRQTHSHGDHSKRRREQNQSNRRQDHIGGSFDQAGPARNGLMRFEPRCGCVPAFFRAALR